LTVTPPRHESDAWRVSGERSAAHVVARETGTGVGAAGAVLETARRLDGLPATREAFEAGRLSELQAREIASAAQTADQDAHRQQVFAAARREERWEPFDAYTADALVAAVTDGAQVATTVVLRADLAAVQRQQVADGEICEIPGVGPVPVEAVREAFGDGFLEIVLTKGVDVRNVVHLGRRATAIQRTALLERDGYRCTGDRCDQQHGLEIDHIKGWAITRTTTLDDLQLRCRWDHRQKTIHQNRNRRRPPRAGPEP
jgi:hypothetical protein